jgi:hypothetical protein
VTLALSFAILLLSGLSSPSLAAPGPIIEAQHAPQERIDSAVSIYIAGDLPGARAELIRLVSDPALSEQELQLARIWLGEVEYVGGEREAARSTFRTVLLYDPDYRMDPFLHPPEVVSFFEATRAELYRPDDPLLPLQPSRPPLPRSLAWLLPGGMQINNGKPLLGASAFVGVAVLAGSTVPIRLWLTSQDQDPVAWGIDVPDAQAQIQVRRVRALQLSAGTAAGLLWMSSAVAGSMHAQRPAGAVALNLSPSSATLWVRF